MDDDIISLRCTNASLEAELRLVKAQLAQSHAGGVYLIDLLGEQRVSPFDTSRRAAIAGSNSQQQQQQQQQHKYEQENKLLQAKLEAALECNRNLTLRLEKFRSAARAVLEHEKRGRIESPTGCGSWIGNDGFVVGNEDDIIAENENARRVAKAVAGWVGTGQWPSSVEAGKGRQIIEPVLQSKQSGSNDAEVESCLSMEAMRSTTSCDEKSQKSVSEPRSCSKWLGGSQAATKSASVAQTLSTSDKKEKTTTPVKKGIRLEASNGETFYVHPPPSPLPGLTPTDEANRRQLRRAGRPINARFHDHEHNRLAGKACWIEDYTEEEYNEHWVKYASEHRDHSAGEWRKYYESKVRPGYLKKIGVSNKQTEKNSSNVQIEKESSASGKRKDSAFAVPTEVEVRSKATGFESEGVNGESRATKAVKSCEQAPLIDLMVVEEETLSAEKAEMMPANEDVPDQHLDNNTNDPDAALVASDTNTLSKTPEHMKSSAPTTNKPFLRYTIQQLHSYRAFATPVAKNLIVSRRTTLPLATPAEQTNIPASPTDDAVLHYKTEQLRECRAFARSVVKKHKRVAPEESDFTTLLDVREMTMRSFDGSTIREVEMGSPTSAMGKQHVGEVGKENVS